MAKKPITVVYNNKPDPVVKITEYEYTGDGLKKTKETVYDKPEEGKTYALTGLGKCIANGNTWKESEVKVRVGHNLLSNEYKNKLEKEMEDK